MSVKNGVGGNSAAFLFMAGKHGELRHFTQELFRETPAWSVHLVPDVSALVIVEVIDLKTVFKDLDLELWPRQANSAPVAFRDPRGQWATILAN